MDFSYLLELAKANEERSKSDSSHKFSTKVSNAKKISKSGPKREAVSSFLDKKEEDKRKEEEEYKRKRSELLALRSQDKHSKRRVKSLINRTKGASKSVLEDAKDITTAVGEEQCDEDDYGYESAISQQIFSKLQNKYSAIPEDERLNFKKTVKCDIEDIKNRVMSSLKQKQEEELGIRKRKRKRKHAEEEDGFINDDDEYKKFDETNKTKEVPTKTEKKIPPNINFTNYKSDKYSQFKYEDREKSEEKVVTKKPKKVAKSAPPPMSFDQLMKMAQKKQADPNLIEKPIEFIEKKKEKLKDVNRPLTAKEKQELEEERIRKLRRMGKLPPVEKESGKSVEKGVKSKHEKEIPNRKELPKSEIKTEKMNDVTKMKENKTSDSTPKIYDKSKHFALPSSLPTPKPVLQESSKKVKDANCNPKSFKKPVPIKEKEIQPKSKIPSRPFPPKHFPPKPHFKKPSSAPPPKRIIDSEEEDEDYDSEMDDFIDDGDAGLDYSSEIAKMFNYDKSKFRDYDDDCADMEASYSQVEKEEKISAKIGLMEDLEDIRREEEEKKRKKKSLQVLNGKRRK